MLSSVEERKETETLAQNPDLEREYIPENSASE
jgi:hypothetical protein